MSNQLEKVKELIALREQARLGGGEKRIESQHKKGIQTSLRSHRTCSYGRTCGMRYVQ